MDEKIMTEDQIIDAKVIDQNIPLTDRDKFPEINSQELKEILGITVKKDDTNKLLTFLCFLSAYAGDCQFNISFNAPSSSGKSFIPLEISKFFPQEDLLIKSYASPTSFFHDVGIFDEEKGGYIVDLSRKIMIFTDQQNTALMERLRSLLSHDAKEISAQITDRSEKKGLRTKQVYIRGYPAVTFCSASFRIDEQESTRFILLSPETDSEKIRAGVYEKILKESNLVRYKQMQDSNPQIIRLSERIREIKKADIQDIRIDNYELIQQLFFERIGTRLKPRHQRDIGRILNIVKIFAVLNHWHRKCDGNTIIANDKDINEAFNIWLEIYTSQELNVSPYLLDFYQKIIWLPYQDKNKGSFGITVGLTRPEIMQKHYEINHTALPDWKLRMEILPSLESANLIKREFDEKDRRRELITPILDLKNYSEIGCGETEQKGDDSLENTVDEFNKSDPFSLL